MPWPWLAAAILALTLSGCGGKPGLTLYCGAGIRPPVAEAAEVFGAESGATIEPDYAGSEVLLGRIKLSGRGDLYMPGEVYYLDLARQEGLVASSRTVCHFVPVILVQKNNPKDVRSLAGLLQPGLRLGLGEAKACAIGRQSSLIFEKNNIDAAAVDRNVVMRALTVNELANSVKLGALDAAIVWDGVAAGVAADTKAVPIPPEQNVISTVAIGVLKTSQHPDLAEEFAEFLASDRGRDIFKKHGYTVAP